MMVNRLKNNALKFCILSLSVLASCAGDSGSAKKGSASIDQQSAAVYKCPMECEGEKTIGLDLPQVDEIVLESEHSAPRGLFGKAPRA